MITVSTQTIRHAWIELTSQCNLECSHCYNESSPTKVDSHKLTQDDYERVLVDLKATGCSSVQFIGGEPTLCRFLPSLISKASQLQFARIELFSNITRLTDDLLDILKLNGARVACSLYSDVAAVHDKITCRGGSHKKTTRNIERIIKYQIPIRVGIIVIPGINDNRIEDTKLFLNHMGVSDVGVDHVRGVGRAQAPNATKEDVVTQLCGHCSDDTVCIDPQGNVSPCIMSKPWRLGSIRDTPIASVFASPQWNEFKDIMAEQRVRHQTGCSPEDQCSPGACHPQIGGPPDCYPQSHCAPDVLPCRPQSISANLN